MTDLAVRAWNYVDDQGEPILEIDEIMSSAEFDRRVRGRFAAISAAWLRPISIEAINRALDAGKFDD